MKTNNILWAILIISLCACSFIVGHSTKVKVVKPTYTQSDSLELVRLDSVKGEYQIVIDSLSKNVKVRYVKIIEYRKVADSLSNGANSNCLPIIKAKDKVIAEQDSTINELDLECRTYSDLNLIWKQKYSLNLKRNKQLTDSVSSLHIIYTDSLTAQRKTSDKAIKKEKTKTFFYKVTTTVAAALGIYGIITK